MFFNPFSTKECFVDNDHNPHVNFDHDVSMLGTQYLVPNKFKTNSKDFSKNSFSILHLNIRTINKKFEAFTQFYSKLNYIFSVIMVFWNMCKWEKHKSSTFQPSSW